MSDLTRAGIQARLDEWWQNGGISMSPEAGLGLYALCERIRDEARTDTEAVSRSLIADLRDELRVHVERWNDDQATIAEQAAELARLREALRAEHRRSYGIRHVPDPGVRSLRPSRRGPAVTERERIGDLIALALSNGHSSLRQYAVIHRTRILRAADAVAADKAEDLERYRARHAAGCAISDWLDAIELCPGPHGPEPACTCGLDAKLFVALLAEGQP